MRHHSEGEASAPAEDPSHSTDQPGGRVQGQVKPAIISSKFSPENKATSKAENTNAQQGLPINGYNLVHLTKRARLFGWRGLFCRKAATDRSLLSAFSFHNSSSINHSKWASISKHPCWRIKHTSISIHQHHVPLVTQCGKYVKQSHWTWAVADSNRVLNLARQT